MTNLKKLIIVIIIIIIIAIVSIFLLQSDDKNLIQSVTNKVKKTVTGCESNTNPVFAYDITDTDLIGYVVPPGNLEDYGDFQVFKSHSYIKGPNKVPVYAPIDSTLYQGAYILEEGISQYALFLEISCEMYYIFDHIVDVRDDIKQAFPDTPTAETNTVSAKNKIEVKAGDLIGYSIGEQFAQWDFGVYDTSSKNFLKDRDDISNLSDRDYYARCPYDYFPDEKKQIYYDLFGSHINQPVPTTFCSWQPTNTGSAENEVSIVEPIDEFKERITKKPFGIFITPDNSPVQPERFAGYHTGVDVEYDDTESEVPVFAIAYGIVVRSAIIDGYGGVTIILNKVGDQNIHAIYGHLDPDSMLEVDAEVTAGQQIGILGEGYTTETDGERKHLHFGMMRTGLVSVSGYVGNEQELEGWHDPMEFFK